MRKREKQLAAAYTPSGRPTGERISLFSWWLAVNDGEILGYVQARAVAEEKGEFTLIAQETNGRIINELHPAISNNGNLYVEMEDKTRPMLYPNCLVCPDVYTLVEDYWFALDGEQVDIELVEEDIYSPGPDNVFELHGNLTDNRELHTEIEHLFKVPGSSQIIAAGKQRYILKNPADSALIQAHNIREHHVSQKPQISQSRLALA